MYNTCLHGCKTYTCLTMAFCYTTGGPATCAVKVVDLPGEGTDEKSLLDLYSEVSILEEFHGKPCVCELFDYGITHEAAFLVMKEYKCSLLVRFRVLLL